ncbi:hypothetical protein [Clostridium tetani]|nr:hypothetical protein [Clostridium tetani]
MTWRHKIPKDVAEKTVDLLHNITEKKCECHGEGWRDYSYSSKRKTWNYT